MPLQLTAAYHTTTGLREHNEDFVGMVTPAEPALSSRGMIAAIADGVSSSSGGREAAEFCVRALLTDYYATSDSWPVTQSLDTVITAINSRLQQQDASHAEHSGMATTLTALVVRGKFYYFAHVGDTRLYLLRDGTLKKLTSDHVSDQPLLSHALTRAIGLGSALTIDHGMGELHAGDIFLLVSDGVWDAIPEDELSWHLSELIDNKRNAEATAKLLTDAALAGGSTDNASALVVRIDQLPEENLRDELSDSQPMPLLLTRPHPFTRWAIIGTVSLFLSWLLYVLTQK